MNDREKVRTWLERFPQSSDAYIAKKTGLSVEDVAEHAGILIETSVLEGANP